MSRKLVSNLKRAYEDELKGLYDPVLLYDICWSLREVLGTFYKRLLIGRNVFLTKAHSQFNTTDINDVKNSTDSLCHEMFLLDTLEKHLGVTLKRLHGSLNTDGPSLMIAVDIVIDSMHIDYPLLSHLVDVETAPLLDWILERRREKTPEFCPATGLRGLFTR
jgi:hypothetical protein